MTASDFAAWYGAALATMVFAWEIWKWLRSGPRLRVSAQPNMSHVTPSGGFGGDRVIFVEAVNCGDQATEITHLAGHVYRSRWAEFRRKGEHFLVVNNGVGPQFPYRLEPGARWTGGINQDELEKHGKEGYLKCGVIDAVSGKQTLAVVKLSALKDRKQR
jgi:hypothetical protein